MEDPIPERTTTAGTGKTNRAAKATKRSSSPRAAEATKKSISLHASKATNKLGGLKVEENPRETTATAGTFVRCTLTT
jgi:hypothetical protein